MTNKSNFSNIKTVLIVTSIFPIIIITIRLLKSNPVVQPEVTIPLGKILGKYTTTRHGRVINEFIGIPYAKPPINELRFQNSVPIEPWDGIFFADNDCPVCSQILENGTYVGVEDCLVINVYTPKIDNKKLLPVMVYIHGGAFVRGDSTPTSVGPDYLLDHDVVLVSMNYRLGVLGFLSTGDHFASGNFGLKDQALALKWVQQYIKYFGGNPDSVTLFGESAGGVSVNFHVLSTATKGLFHRYIAQSGSALCPWAFAESTTYKKYATLLGEKFNCPTNSSKHLIMCLQNINVFDIIHSNIFTGLQGLTGITWVPTDEPDNEDAFLTDVPLKMLLDGKIQDLPSISGGVKDEGLLVTTLLYANETMYNSLLGNFDEFLKLITDTYIPKGHSASIAKSIKDFYFEDFNVHDIAKTMKQLTNFVSDVAFIFPQELQLELAIERSTNPHYYYSFEYRGTWSRTSIFLKNNKDIGVSHTDDLIYLFKHTPDMYELPNTIQLNKNDDMMIDIFTELWASFAITGIPTTSYANNSNIWEPYNKTKNQHLSIKDTTNITLQEKIREPQMRFWGSVLLKLLFWSIK